MAGLPEEDAHPGLDQGSPRVCGRLALQHGLGELELEVTQLFEQFRDTVYRYLIVTLGSAAEAEEITQEVFLQLYRSLDSGQKISNFRAWIFRVAHNLALNQKASMSRIVTLDLDAWNHLCQARRDPGLDPEQQLLEQEKSQKFHAALRGLSSQQRQCLTLRTEGFRYREIAEILGIAVANVAQSLRRGIKKLVRETHA